MGSDLIAAAVRLADALAKENAALSVHNLPAAAAMLAEKRAALAAFDAAGGAEAEGPARPPATDAAAGTLAAKLRELAETNRRLLERAIAVQGRVVAIVAEAAGGRGPARASGYTARGTIRRPPEPLAIAVTERV